MKLKGVQFTIKQRLFVQAAGALIFLAAASATGYWGINSVGKAIAQEEASGAAVRSHVEAGVFNDLTRDDISSILLKKGDERQSIADNLALHSKLLAEHIADARALATDPPIQSALEEERETLGQYLSASASLSQMSAQDPPTAAAVAQVGVCLLLYQKLQGEIEDSEDQLEKAARIRRLVPRFDWPERHEPWSLSAAHLSCCCCWSRSGWH
jgi:hypothetical protein